MKLKSHVLWMNGSQLPELNLNAAGNEAKAQDVKPAPAVSLSCAALNHDNKFNIHHKQQLESLSILVACPYFWAINAGYQLCGAVHPADLVPAE